MSIKKLTAIMLSGAMLTGAVSLPDMPVKLFSDFSTSAADIVDSGKCGENLTWELDSEGTLTISGTGKMKDYSLSSDIPWNSSKNIIKNVTIENGVTSIGYCAFNHFSNLTKITIPDSVTSIGERRFSGCEGLESITIPDSVTNIGAYAFRSCKKLKSITIINPDCNIYDSSSTICNSSDNYKYYGVINGYKCSTAEQYAKNYSRKFKLLEGEPPAVTTTTTVKQTTTTVSKSTTTTTTVLCEPLKYGDANCDGKTTVADVVAILQHIGNRDKYGLNVYGLANADVDGIAGVTAKDALVIQQVDAGIYKIEDLPLKVK